MSLAPQPQHPASFGTGGAEPYARALRASSDSLYLLDAHSTGTVDAQLNVMDVSRWNARADEADLTLLGAVDGPVLDVGCGPGRMVRAALDLGLVALGVDVSPAAVEVARSAGLPVLHRSIFAPMPGEGTWQTVLLVDGNIGIGGDPDQLLARCAELLAPTGEIVVELHVDAARDRRFTGRLVDAVGRASATFPWAEIGLDAITARATELQLVVRQSWDVSGRTFCRLATA